MPRLRYVSRYGANKERIAALPIGGSLLVGSEGEADCLRYAATQMSRRVSVRPLAFRQALRRLTRTA